MAFKVLFYDAVNGSPSYNSDDFANYFKQFSSDGILGSTGGECAVTAVSGSRKVKIAKGCVLFDGRQIIIDEAGVALDIPQNTITNYVVLEQTITTGVIEPKIVQSVTASGKKYILLAAVQTGAASAGISNGDIADKRVFAAFNLKNQRSLPKKIVFKRSEYFSTNETKTAFLKIAKPAVNHNYVKAHIELNGTGFPALLGGSSFHTNIILDRTGNHFGFAPEEDANSIHTLGTHTCFVEVKGINDSYYYVESMSDTRNDCAGITLLTLGPTISFDIYLEEDEAFYVIKLKKSALDSGVTFPQRTYQISAVVEFE